MSDYLQRTFGLPRRTALVTGAGRGIGRAVAQALGHAGARVVVNDLRPEDCEETVALLRQAGVEARAADFDVSDQAAVMTAQDRLDGEGWPVDILVSNAGVQNRKPLLETRFEEWQALMEVHVHGALHCSQAFLPGMCSRGFGRVIMMSSVSAVATMPLIAAYSTAKAALAAMARAIAVEHGPYGVTANAIAPGFVRTDFTVGLQQRKGFENFLQEAVPCGRWAAPEDIAPAVLFLASPAGSFVNGQLLAIDGGMLAKL
jgi:gluconate 5-dehydrogenase